MNYRKIPYYGLFAALAILMGYVEFMIPVPVPIPGVKLGLANVIVIIMLYFMDAKSAFFVSLIVCCFRDCCLQALPACSTAWPGHYAALR